MHDRHDIEMLRRMGVRIPGVTDREKKRFTPLERERLLGRTKQYHSHIIREAELEQVDLDQMINDILGGYRNSHMHYRHYGKNRSFQNYTAMFDHFLRELRKFRR